MCMILNVAIFVIEVNYADDTTITWIVLWLVILFCESQYLPENIGTQCLKKPLVSTCH